MNPEKRIVLICDKDKELVTICKSVVKKYDKVKLEVYYGQAEFSEFIHKNLNNVSCAVEILFMIDSFCTFMTIEESISELRNDRALMDAPILVLIDEVDRNVMQSWFDKNISSVVLKTEDTEGMAYILSHIFDYWYNTTRLPDYTMPNPNLVFGQNSNNLSFDL